MAEPLGLETEEPIDDSVRVQEGIMLGLRLKEGINFLDFQLTHGVDLQSKFAQQIAKLQKGEFLEVSKTHLRLTAKAFPVSNLVIGEFF
jgi:coproporphyrinogen III oxidase-like Fe-S oxidoreductase